jgi:hypothetical protein
VTRDRGLYQDSRAPVKVALLARSVFPIHGYGGLERHVYDLARALAERGVEVTLITPPPPAAAVHAGVHSPARQPSSSRIAPSRSRTGAARP